MADKVVKNPEQSIPYEDHSNFEEEIDSGTDDLSKLEPEEIADILRKQKDVKPTETPSEKTTVKDDKDEDALNEEEIIKALGDAETEDETDDNESATDAFNLPDKLKGKSLEEIAKMYINAEKLSSTHTTELGELRKQKTELASAKELAKKYELEMSAAKVTPAVQKWTSAEIADFIQKLGEDPQAAFASLINPYIKPLATSTAQTRNERMEDLLTKENENKVVPYNHEAVDTILKANPELWKEHGTKAIKVAFNMYKEDAFPALMEAKEKEFMDGLIEKKNNKDKGQATHVMGVGTGKTKGTNTGNMAKAIAKLDKMDPDKALAILGKVLKYSE